MSGKYHSAQNRHGFTLLELLIVLLLITLIMGLSALYFAKTLPSNTLNATARELSATIRYAHSLSQVEGSNRILTIDMGKKIYGIEGRGYKSMDPAITIKVLDPFAGEITEGTYQFVFHASGGMDGGTIILGSTKIKREIKIELDPVVGSVVIK